MNTQKVEKAISKMHRLTTCYFDCLAEIKKISSFDPVGIKNLEQNLKQDMEKALVCAAYEILYAALAVDDDKNEKTHKTRKTRHQDIQDFHLGIHAYKCLGSDNKNDGDLTE